MKTLVGIVAIFLILNPCLTALEVDVPDVRLREAINKELGKDVGDKITKSDMETLKILTVEGCKQLTGIEEAVCLESLLIAKSEVTDISNVENLKHLAYFTMLETPIKDIAPLSNLKSLNSVFLYKTQVSDIQPLVDNKNLNGYSIIRLDKNPLTYKSQRILIPKLVRIGVRVIFSPKCRLYDLNTDGRISVLDMIIIGNAIGSDADAKDHPADVNYDGVIDIVDIEIVADIRD